jgi:hypothetical protein
MNKEERKEDRKPESKKDKSKERNLGETGEKKNKVKVGMKGPKGKPMKAKGY